MEIQTETEFIEVKSPIDRFKEQWANQPGKLNFFRQRDFILGNVDLVQYAELAAAKGWTQPLRFSLVGLLLAAFVLSTLSWMVTRDEGTQADQIASVRAELESEIKTEQGAIDAAQFDMARVERSRRNDGFTVASSKNLNREEALAQLRILIEEARKLQQEYQYHAEIKIQNLRAAGDAVALAASGTPVMVSLALLFAAPLFRKLMQRSYARSRPVQQADSYYLYYVVSHGIWMNCALVVLLNLFLSRSAYGLSGFFEAIGPVGRILLWLALYALLAYWFFPVSKDLHKAMRLPRPGEYLGPENKVLLHMHNSFWTVFTGFEAALAVLAYTVYLLERS
jgi:hypothetical protein